MRLNSISNIAKTAHYDRSTKALSIGFIDGSTLTIPVRLLEMVVYREGQWVTIEPNDEQLEAVEVGVHGDRVTWDELEQCYRISDLKAGIYGRESWMASLSMAVAL